MSCNKTSSFLADKYAWKPSLVSYSQAAAVTWHVAAIPAVVCFTYYVKHADALHQLLSPIDSVSIITSALFLLALGLCISIYQRVRPLPCYLIDFCCTKGDERDRASIANFLSVLRSWRSTTDDNLKFQYKVFLRSGVGEEAYAPAAFLQKGEDVDMQDARAESDSLISDAARRLLQKTGVDPTEIDFLIVNYSCFCPAPSSSAYLVNVLKMRSDVKSFNLAGMGCSAGLIAIDLAARLLRVHPNSYALIVSTQNVTSNMYYGNDRSMMVSNCLFRCGCSAVLLTNKHSARAYAKMQLLKCLRIQLSDDKAYGGAQHVEDSDGKLGISLQVYLPEIAGVALRENVTKLAPSILPWSEIVKVAINFAQRKVLKKAGVQAYEPNFKKAIDHFCIHPGGRAVIDKVAEGLQLSKCDAEPARMALERFGNTSSSGIWYALAYCEAKGRLKRGNKVWQIGFGSGFKCNSGVWRVLQDMEPSEICNPWLSCIDRYPIPDNIVEERTAKIKDIDSVFAVPVAKLEKRITGRGISSRF